MEDGTVWCWGAEDKDALVFYDPYYGELGSGSRKTGSSVPVQVSRITTATQVSVGSGHSCATLQDGTVWCWGENYFYGELGNGTDEDFSSVPVQVSGITTATQVSAGVAHSCATLQDGTVRCWGSNGDGELGNGAEGQLDDGTGIDSSVPVQVSGITTATQVSAGRSHSCATLQDGTVRCWGFNGNGELGDGTGISSSVPVQVSALTTAIQVSAGRTHSCATLQNGTVRCWGANDDGKLGDGTNERRSSVPLQVFGITTATQVSVAEFHSCATLQDGTVRCWGSNRFGKLGDGTTTSSPVPVQVSGITTATQISAGDGHTCATLQDGTVRCWGSNSNGKLGDGTATNSSIPVQVSGITTATQVSAGSGHSCATLQDGTVWCWGANDDGELGNGAEGQLDDGTGIDSSVPVQVSGITTATQVSTGGSHSCALLQDGTVRCWGSNRFGKLGDGTRTDSSIPVQVSGITTATQVSVGSCATLQDGTIWCWSEEGNAQVSGITTAIQGVYQPYINRHSCATLQNGTVRCWGANDDGQLGDGTRTFVPVQVLGIPVE